MQYGPVWFFLSPIPSHSSSPFVPALVSPRGCISTVIRDAFTRDVTSCKNGTVAGHGRCKIHVMLVRACTSSSTSTTKRRRRRNRGARSATDTITIPVSKYWNICGETRIKLASRYQNSNVTTKPHSLVCTTRRGCLNRSKRSLQLCILEIVTDHATFFYCLIQWSAPFYLAAHWR